jgi:hypothetical protein
MRCTLKHDHEKLHKWYNIHLFTTRHRVRVQHEVKMLFDNMTSPQTQSIFGVWR